jgi:hypothetical protein
MSTELINGLPKTPEWEEVVKPIADAAATISTDELYDESGDPKARANAAAEVTKTLQDAMGEMAAIVQCAQALKDEISKSKPEDESKTIGDLSKDSDGTDFPTADDIAKGVEKAYQIPEWFNKAWQAGSKAAEEAAKGGGAAAKAKSAEIAGQTPWEGVKAMGGDWKSKAGSLFKKEAGEETGKKVLSKTVTDVTEKNIIESLATKSGADITDIIPDPTKIVDIGGGASQGGNISNIFSGADVATSQLPEYASYGDALKQREKYQGMFNRFQQGGDTSSEAWDAMWNT